MASILGIGVSALNAAQAGLATTEHNIANATTPGYTRQQTVQSTNIPQITGAGFLGQGVNVLTVKRIFSDYLNTQLLQQQAQSSQLSTYYSQIQQINNVIADPVAGLQSSIQDFFSAVSGVANAPGSQPARQTMLSSAQTLTARLQSTNQLLTDMNSGINSQITATVASINSYAQQIASLNHNISMATASTSQTPNDLLDQRDQLVSQLNQLVKTTVIKQTDGSYNVFIGNGQGLVIGEQASTFQAVPSLNDPSKLEVAYSNSFGGTARMPQNSLQGGTLGGLLAFRDQSLTTTQNMLGLVATGLAATLNDQQKLGQDLNGALGNNLFNLALPAVNADANNTGTAVASASIADVSALTGSDYTLAYDGTNYTVTRLSDNVSTSYATLPQTLDGVTFNSTGVPNPGDSFLIRPTVNGARDISVAITDTSKIAAAVPVRATAALTNIGTGTVSAATVNAPPPTDVNLQQPVTITFDNPPTTYSVTGTGTGTPSPVNIPYTPGQNITYNGWTIQISGTPLANDVFTVAANNNASADGNNALLMAGLQTQNTLLGGTASYEGAFGQLISQVGSKTNELKITSQAQANMVSQTTQAQQSISGVNLDEEAANLIRYQQAYQAAGKAIQIAGTLFDTVLNLQR
ncbi:MAG: flagellar hook-associated protein FlgK [Sideroxydans sp.]|nr:flagellar hook-associated protein FlgK [Sideroxydans sp.]